MKRFLAWAATGDWVNAVAIKEFRQAVQSRWVIAVLMLFLLIDLFFVGSYLALSPDAETSAHGGRATFASLLAILMGTCLSFVPLYSGIRLSLERNDANIDLLFITTIRPGAIVRGKYLSAMALTLLIFSACMPFMALTYLLGGVDVPTIFFLLAAGYAACAVVNAVGIFAGSVPGPWLIRGLVGGGVVLLLFYAGFGVIAVLDELVIRGMGIATVDAWRFLGLLGTVSLLALLAIGLFYVLSVALLSPALSNRMLVPRMYLIVVWVATASIAAAWTWHEHEVWPIGSWMIGSGIALMVTAVAAMGERDTWTARVRRTIPRNPLLRAVAFLLYSGSAGGVIWSAIMFAASLGVTFGSCRLFGLRYGVGHEQLDEAALNLATVVGYVFCYCLTTAFLRTTVFRRLPTASLALITLILASFAAIAPYTLDSLLVGGTWRTVRWYMLVSPMALAVGQQSVVATAAPVVLAWLAVGVLMSCRWALGQWRQFAPLQEYR